MSPSEQQLRVAAKFLGFPYVARKGFMATDDGVERGVLSDADLFYALLLRCAEKGYPVQVGRVSQVVDNPAEHWAAMLETLQSLSYGPTPLLALLAALQQLPQAEQSDHTTKDQL